jgi:putative ABC transport system substrate-binding protein
MRRRDFLTLLGGAAAAWPLVAMAQQPAMPVVGYLYGGAPDPTSNRLVSAFLKGLSEAGYVEGRNVAIEYRFAHDDSDRLPGLTADLVRRNVAVIAVIGSTLAALAAKAATATIPIVFHSGADPVQSGLVASLNRPGGNVTGITSISAELGPKRLSLLRELLPGATRFAVLVNSNAGGLEDLIADLRAAAAAIGCQIEVFNARTYGEIDAAFASLAQWQADALFVQSTVLLNARRPQLATLAVNYKMPAIYPFRENTEFGGLMSYGPNVADNHRQTGVYVARILKGEKPANLPVMRPTRFELVINLHTARLLGITIPPTLLAIADEVIE